MSLPKIILDCDPGIDDAFAIAVAARHTNLVAITTVAGNVTLEHTTNNALLMAQFCDLDVPVISGSARPVVADPLYADDVHGASGLGDGVMPDITQVVAGTDAVTALLEMVDHETTVVAVGPLTNIAHAIRRDPDWQNRIERLVIMGGSTGAGNATSAAEFNIWADPEAAAEVFESGISLTMVGLNLTQQVRMGAPQIDLLRESGSDVAEFLADALEYYADYSLREYGVARSAMHDPCAVLYVSHPELFVAEPMHCVVEVNGAHTRGMTHIDTRANSQEPNIEALVHAEADAVVDLIVAAAISPTPPLG